MCSTEFQILESFLLLSDQKHDEDQAAAVCCVRPPVYAVNVKFKISAANKLKLI